MIAQLWNSIQNLFHRKKLQIYTDGSQKGAWGSWAFVIVKKNKIIHEASGRERLAGSNRMEFQAAVKALTYLPEHADAQVFTDSRILINAIKGLKQPSAHEDQILNLRELCENKRITWHWVKAHSGIKYNERCDELCIQARENF